MVTPHDALDHDLAGSNEAPRRRSPIDRDTGDLFGA
jgi:hypothetical protein